MAKRRSAAARRDGCRVCHRVTVTEQPCACGPSTHGATVPARELADKLLSSQLSPGRATTTSDVANATILLPSGGIVVCWVLVGGLDKLMPPSQTPASPGEAFGATQPQGESADRSCIGNACGLRLHIWHAQATHGVYASIFGTPARSS